ncbi:hypothetical protein PQX77_017637 [Marasmius sp. AFHP31]|nr:hypothetical protein PQX77_017637 [Marasmius sp. AFHP31]
MQSTFFPDARDFVISHSSFSHVEGDQHNTHNIRVSRTSTGAATAESSRHNSIAQGTTVMTIHGNQFNQVIQQAEKEPTEFDDFRIVKRGDICRDRDVVQFSSNQRWWGDPDCQCEFCKREKVIKTVCIGKVEGTRGTFTVMSYSGPGGRKAFEQDFREFSGVVSSRVPQMYAVDIGSIPSILYWNELVPAVVLKENVGLLGQAYLYSLRRHWNCTEGELWMDPTRGVICRGPEGPYPNLLGISFETDDMPSTVDLLQEDACLRFMASCKSKVADHAFVRGIRSAGSDVGVPESFDQPTVISALTQTPIAVAKNVWESDDLVERTVLESGLTRSRVVGGGVVRLWWNINVVEAWLCQALGVFHTQGIGLDVDLSVYRLVRHKGCLDGDLANDEIHCQRRSQQPIYLFLHPPPLNQPNGKTSSLHFWSSHEDGQSPLPPDICHDLGLPTTLKYWRYSYISYSWPTNTYKQLDKYQRLRGFDPTTTDFARHLGYDGNIFNPVNDTDRFDEDYEDQHTKCQKPPDLDHGQSNVDNDASGACGDTLYNPVGEPTLTHVVADVRTNAEEGRMDYCYDGDQNLHSANDDIFDMHTMAEPFLQRIPPCSRRSTPNYSPAHTGYPPNTTSLPQHRIASTDLHESHWNSSFPSSPEVLLTTSHSFSVFDGLMNAASTTGQTEITAGQSLETPQHTISTVPSRCATSPSPQWNPYAGAPVTNGFPHFTATPTSSVSSLDAFPMSAYASAVGYPTNPLPMGSLPETLPTAGHDYRSMPSDAPNNLCDSVPTIHNTGYQTDNGRMGPAMGIDAFSEDEQESHLVTSISGISNNHGTYAREVGSAAVVEATDDCLNQPIPSSSQPDVEELCGNGFDCLSQRGDIRDKTQGTDTILGPTPTPDSSFRHAGVDLPTSSARNEEPEEILDSVPAIASERSEGLSLNGNIPNVATGGTFFWDRQSTSPQVEEGSFVSKKALRKVTEPFGEPTRGVEVTVNSRGGTNERLCSSKGEGPW